MTRLTDAQMAALAELNSALYKARITGLLEKFSSTDIADSFYQDVGGLCAENRISTPEREKVFEEFNAKLFAVTKNPERLHVELFEFAMGIRNPDIYRCEEGSEEWPSPSEVAKYQVGVVLMDDPEAELIDFSLPADTPQNELLGLANQILFCQIPATFRPQTPWANNRTADIDGGGVPFNAMGNLIKMDLKEVQAMFASGRDFDRLADGLPARESHDGPFEVDIDEAAVVRMVCLFAGMHGALDEDDGVSDITQLMWDEFESQAFKLLKLAGGIHRELPVDAVPVAAVESPMG